MLRFKNIPGPLALGMLVLTLLVYNLGGWYLYDRAQAMAERELERKLAAIGRTAALQLNEDDTPILMLADPQRGLDPYIVWEDYEAFLAPLRRHLAKFRDANALREVTILARNRVVLADASPNVASGSVQFAHDAPFIEDAFASNTIVQTPYYHFREQDHKRCFVPLVSDRGAPLAVLRLAAGREYFVELQQMRGALVLICGVGSLLLAGVALALYRLLAMAVRSERAMADADRLQSLGTLAAGIAHEIRNPLGIIRAISEELEADLADQEEQRQLLRDITEEVDRLNGLVTQFLTFARPGPSSGAPRPFDLHETLRDVVKLVQKGSDTEQVTYVLEHAGPPMRLLMEEKSIRQVLLNVLFNAREAVGGRGAIRVHCDQAGAFARVRVHDSGPGMDAKQIKRAFDPFYTTKSAGTGLGLSISRNIVERYGGRISIESEPGKGATVEILLPVGVEKGGQA